MGQKNLLLIWLISGGIYGFGFQWINVFYR